jgi:hypothetical protein
MESISKVRAPRGQMLLKVIATMEMMACHGNQQLAGSEPQDGVRGFSLTAEKTAHSKPSTWEFTIKTSDPQCLYAVL